jgi:hypothetical protein
MTRKIALLLLLAALITECWSTSSSTSSLSSSSIDSLEQVELGRPQLDRSKPVPPNSDVIKAWQKRQNAIKTFRFVWTEQQTHPKGWIPNPRFAEREWLAIPGLLGDRSYAVSKTLTVDGNKMRYGFEIDRKEEADGVIVVSPQGENQGLGERRHYSYLSVFNGQLGKNSLTSLTNSLPSVISQTITNVDAQNLDTRVILIAYRPLDPVMGHLLIDRAVTNRVRTFYKGKSIFILEEQRDPSGWKTLVWIEPERDFLVCRFLVAFEQKVIVDIDIDYVQDSRSGWIPDGWRVTERLGDGSKRLVAVAKVLSYSINQPIGIEEFQ